MIEARAFIDDIEPARTKLKELHADFRGYYRIHDTIFHNHVTNAPLSEEFLRLRYVPTNIWDEKAVILAIKKTIPQKMGKISDIPTKLQFDTVEEARCYYETHLRDTYSEDYSFWRDGWQYYLDDGDVVDLEIVEKKHHTVELKSETDKGIQKLIDQFGVSEQQIISGPSVVAVKELL